MQMFRGAEVHVQGGSMEVLRCCVALKLLTEFWHRYVVQVQVIVKMII